MARANRIARPVLIGGTSLAATGLLLGALSTYLAHVERSSVPTATAIKTEILPPPVVETTQIEARPPFRDGRRLADPMRPARAQETVHVSATVRPVPPPSVGGLRLLGTVIQGGDRMALISSPTHRPAGYLRVGQGVEQWVVSEIQPDHVILKSGATFATLSLHSNSALSSQTPSPSLYAPGGPRPTPGKWPQ